MKILGGLIVKIFANGAAILAADYLIKGFSFTGNLKELALAAFALTVINIFLKPFLKLFFGPFIFLSLGLFVVVINALTLYLLDILINPLIIEGYLPLILASLLMSAVSVIITFAAKIF